MTKIKSRKAYKALCYSLIFSVVMTMFPVASGVIIAINKIDSIKGYLIQSAFMILSLLPPLFYMLFSKISPSKIGVKRIEKGSAKILLYFLPLVASKVIFLFFGIKNNIYAVITLILFTLTIGVSEETYFRGLILKKLATCFNDKEAVILSSVFFAIVHASQAFSGSTLAIVLLSILNAFIFGVVAAEITLISKSIIVNIIWHALFDFINWISLVKGTGEIVLIIVQTVIMVIYAAYLWTKLSEKRNSAQ